MGSSDGSSGNGVDEPLGPLDDEEYPQTEDNEMGIDSTK